MMCECSYLPPLQVVESFTIHFCIIHKARNTANARRRVIVADGRQLGGALVGRQVDVEDEAGGGLLGGALLVAQCLRNGGVAAVLSLAGLGAEVEGERRGREFAVDVARGILRNRA